MDRQLIRIDNLPDQAGITAALRRAFAAHPATVDSDEDDPFSELLERMN